MKKFFLAMAALVALTPSEGALAQSVTQLPVYIQNNLGQVSDFGNGPLELRVIQGSAQLFTSQGSGLGATATSTAVTLTATPATPPCVGCSIVGAGIPANDTVAAFNGTTGITLAAAATATASGVALSWGAACPATLGASFPVAQVQANIGADLPLYTTARICGASQYSAGALVLPFAIGAH